MKIVNRKELLFLNFMAYSLIGNAGVIQLDNPKGEDGKVLTITNVQGRLFLVNLFIILIILARILMFMVQTLE